MAYMEWTHSRKTGELLKVNIQMEITDYFPKTKVTSITPEDKTIPGLEDELEGNSWEDTYKANRVSDSLD